MRASRKLDSSLGGATLVTLSFRLNSIIAGRRRSSRLNYYIFHYTGNGSAGPPVESKGTEPIEREIISSRVTRGSFVDKLGTGPITIITFQREIIIFVPRRCLTRCRCEQIGSTEAVSMNFSISFRTLLGLRFHLATECFVDGWFTNSWKRRLWNTRSSKVRWNISSKRFTKDWPKRFVKIKKGADFKEHFYVYGVLVP